jgi:DNA-binding NarL/FixJ family response regulator
MDIDMPALDGIGATRAIRRDHPDIRVIGLSMFEEKERAQALSEAGAVRYLSKSGRSADLIAAILACASGRTRGPRAG